MSESFSIEYDRPDRTYRVGDIIRGRVVIHTTRGDRCKAVRLRRFWRTHGKGNVDKGEPMGVLLHSGPLEGSGPFEFSFEFPAPPGPFTYHGRYLNIDQFVEARVDLPWALDPKLREEYVLLPGTPVSPPVQLLEKPDESTKNVLLGCSAFVGISVSVFGLFTSLLLNPMGLLFLLGGMGILIPYLRAKAAERLGNATAFLASVVVEPGQEAELEVKVAPRKSVELKGAYLELRAREICVSGSGSSQRTHRHELFSGRSTLSGGVTLEGGKVRVFKGSVRIPEDAPPSFKAGDNRLSWEAKVRLDIPAWPDWVKKIPLVVWPAGGRLEAPRKSASLEALEDPAGPPELGTYRTETEEAFVSHGWSEITGKEDPVQEGLAETSTERPSPLPEAQGTTREAIVDGPAGEPSTQGLGDAIHEILEGELFGGERDRLIKDLIGGRFQIVLEVKRVDRSLGLYSEPAYRDGRTVTGTLLESEDEVVVFFSADRNGEVDAWESGSVHDVQGRVKEWDRLRKRPELLAEA